jgi:hypothetical protein
MTAVAEIVNEKEYGDLLLQAMPHVIHTEAENDRCTAMLETLLRKSGKTGEEQRIVELLTLLIEDFEERLYSLPASSPIDITGASALENSAS